MSIVRTIIATVFLCSISFAQQPADTAGIRNSVLAVMERQVAGWNSRSIEKFMEGYERSDSLRFASGGSVTYGWNTMLERYRRSYSSSEKMGTLTFTDIAVTVISPSAALVFGTWALHRAHDTPTGLFTLVFRKSEKGWRIVHDHTSAAEEKK
ncbi:MAG: YybH family protein [Bacteroidota bacterium]